MISRVSSQSHDNVRLQLEFALEPDRDSCFCCLMLSRTTAVRNNRKSLQTVQDDMRCCLHICGPVAPLSPAVNIPFHHRHLLTLANPPVARNPNHKVSANYVNTWSAPLSLCLRRVLLFSILATVRLGCRQEAYSTVPSFLRLRLHFIRIHGVSLSRCIDTQADVHC